MKSNRPNRILLGWILTLAIAQIAGSSFALDNVKPGHPALEDTTIMIVRHAEKPDSGFNLSPAGEKRAEAYVTYFKHLTLPNQTLPLTPDYLVATADSAGSHRPRLTLEPLSKSLGIKIDSRFKNKNFEQLVGELESQRHGHKILIAWHHGEIPELIKAFGANPEKLLGKPKWPSEEFGWLVLLRFDREGRLLEDQSTCIHEHLMPDDK